VHTSSGGMAPALCKRINWLMNWHSDCLLGK
jgi:hypothetical protein